MSRINKESSCKVFLMLFFIARAGGFECNRTMSDGSRTFFLTQAVLDDVSGDVQQVVDCVGPKSTIVVDAGLTVHLASTVHFTKEVVFRSSELGESRPVFECPQDKPLFEIRSKGVVLRNFVVSNCMLTARQSSALVVDITDAQSEEGEENPDILIDNVDFLHNANSEGPGALYVRATASAVILNAIFMNNTGRDGGAVGLHADGSVISFDKCAFLENSALENGGAVAQTSSADLVISDSHFLLNRAHFMGGAVSLQGGQLLSSVRVISSNFEGNFVSSHDAHNIELPAQALGGGAIALNGPHLKFRISSSNFTENTASTNGGGIQIRGLTNLGFISGYLESVRFVNNIAEAGGGLSIQSSSVNTTIEVHRGEFIENVARSRNDDSVDSDDSVTQDGPVQGLSKSDTSRPRGGAINVETVVGIVIQECILRGNQALRKTTSDRPASGGALHLHAFDGESLATISDSAFIENESDEGGALALDGPVILDLVEKVSFNGNRAREQGGAIVMGGTVTVTGSKVTFAINQAGTNGGAVAIKGYSDRIKLSSSIFKENEATQGSGGALFLPGDGSVVQLLSETLLVGNRARSAGGAIAIFCTNCLVRLSQTSIDENSSQDSGGGVFAKSIGGGAEIIFADVSFVENSVHLMHSETKEFTGSGGALMIEGSGVKLSTLGFIYFRENKAREGAAIRLVDCGLVTVDNAVFESNSGSSGGGIYATFANEATNNTLYVTNTAFVANTAVIGGGLMVDGPRYLEPYLLGENALPFPISKSDSSPASLRIALVNISMQYQSVDEEGAGLFLVGTRGECKDCTFHANTVHNLRTGFGGGISLRKGAHLHVLDSVLSVNSAAIGGGASAIDSTLIGERLEITQNTASSFGGGVSVLGTGTTSEEMNPPSLEMESCKLEENKAKKGAGISINVKETSGPKGCLPFIQDMMAGPNMALSLREAMRKGSSSNCDKRESVRIKLTNVSMERNTAEDAGGGLYVHRPGALCACCDGSCTAGCGDIAQVGAKSLLDVCSKSWISNKASRGYGQDVASGVVSVDVVAGNGTEPDHEHFVINNHASGDALGDFTFRFLDVSGHVVTSSPPGAVMRLVAENGGVSGQVEKVVVSGLATFTDTIVSARPGNFQLTAVLPSEFRLPEETLTVRIRECVPGEHAEDVGGPNEFRCVKCGDQTFSLNPTDKCRPCPENATCNGQHVIPVEGFWASDSRPDEVHKCLVKAACSRRIENSNSTLPHSSETCSKGYEGSLCGTCSEGYGRFRRFECQECPSKSTSIALVVVLSSWTLFLLWFLIRNSLKPQKVVRTVAEPRPPVQQEIVPCPQQEEDQIRFAGLNQSAEAAKVFINFVQLTSMALLIQMEWPEVARGLLRLEDGLTGIAADGGVFFFDCLLQEWSTSLLLRHCLLSLAVPAGLLVLLLAFWLLRACLKPLEFACLVRHLATTATVFTYVFYSGIVQRVFGLLHGIRVGHETTENGLGNMYWIDGLTAGYFSGNHLLVAIIVGVPTFIVLVGFPMAIVKVLRCQKQQTFDAGLAARYGFLYRAYQDKYMHWELVIIVRKVLIVTVVVFGGPWQPRLQGVTCLMIMVVALVAHVSAQPFRDEVSRLNHLEAYSLAGTIVTYTAGLVFEGASVAHWSRIVVSICIVVVALFIVGCISKTILNDYLEDIDTWLEKEGIVRQDAPWTTKMKATKEWLWRKSMKLFWNRIERMNGDRAWHLERKKTIAYRAAMEYERAQQLGISIA